MISRQLTCIILEYHWYFDVVIVFAAASYPITTPDVTDGCIPEGQEVSLTCQVTYSGTNLMPLATTWYKHAWISGSYRNFRVDSGDTVNVSSVHQSSFTFKTTTTDIYNCKVSFSSPTGIVVRGVQKQSRNTPTGNFRIWSPLCVSRTLASKITAYMSIVDVVLTADYHFTPIKCIHQKFIMHGNKNITYISFLILLSLYIQGNIGRKFLDGHCRSGPHRWYLLTRSQTRSSGFGIGPAIPLLPSLSPFPFAPSFPLSSRPSPHLPST